MTLNERRYFMEDGLRWKTSFDGRKVATQVGRQVGRLVDRQVGRQLADRCITTALAVGAVDDWVKDQLC